MQPAEPLLCLGMGATYTCHPQSRTTAQQKWRRPPPQKQLQQRWPWENSAEHTVHYYQIIIFAGTIALNINYVILKTKAKNQRYSMACMQTHQVFSNAVEVWQHDMEQQAARYIPSRVPFSANSFSMMPTSVRHFLFFVQ